MRVRGLTHETSEWGPKFSWDQEQNSGEGNPFWARGGTRKMHTVNKPIGSAGQHSWPVGVVSYDTAASKNVMFSEEVGVEGGRRGNEA